jgi:CrcB protein
MRDILWVCLGCALGGMARYFVSGFVARRIGETFPWGTLVVNVSGAFVIGLVAASANFNGAFADMSLWRLAVVGFLGSYTTVSSFSLQTLMLVRDAELTHALSNVALSVGLCLPAAALGMYVGGRIIGQM